MNILLNVRWPVGGIRTYLRYVYRLFPSDKYSFTLLASPSENFEIIRNDLGSRLNSIVVCEPTIGKMFSAISRLIRRNEYDLVHSHGLSSALLAALPLRFSSLTHVATLHDVFLVELFQGVKGRLRYFIINRGLRWIDVLHLLGDDPKENLARFFPSVAQRKNRLTIIKSGIEVERFSDCQKLKGSNTLRADNRIPDSTPILGFFGRFMAQKGFGALVDAIEILSKGREGKYVPTVIAFGGGGFLKREKRMLQERGLMHHFLFLPFLPNIADVLAQLDGVVMPSRWETAPILPMEVLVSGTPLIASNCIGLREITQQTPTFVFETDDPSDLAATLRQWSIDSRKEQFVAFAPDAALRFDVRNTAAELQGLYVRLTSGLSIENSGKAS